MAQSEPTDTRSVPFSEEEKRRRLQEGQPLLFFLPVDSTVEARSIQAGWLEELIERPSNKVRVPIEIANAIIIGPLRFNTCLIIRDSMFMHDVQLMFVEFNRIVSFNGCHFHQDLLLRGARARFDFTINNAICDGNTILENFRAGEVLSARGTCFGTVHFEAMDVGYLWTFRRAHFHGPANFSRSRSGKDAEFSGAEFGADAVFHQADIGGLASFDVDDGQPVRFRGDASFIGAKIAGQAVFNGVQFDRAGIFDGMEVGHGGAFFKRDQGYFVQFGGPARFLAAHIGGQVIFAGAQFEQDAVFDGIHVEQSAHFRGESGQPVRFRGEVRFVGADIGGEAVYIGAEFGRRADFYSVKIGQDAIFEPEFSI